MNKKKDLALSYILDTNEHIFLTGKAGTGKTTLLQEVLKKTDKNMVVVAPTGVAAINAGGVTIHSLFQLPPSCFIPSTEAANPDLFTNRSMLREHLTFRKEKRLLFKSLDTLVIDEISMVRADLLDAIDFALRYVRGSTQAFGGVQIVMIGDLFQLPPVVKDFEWEMLRHYYKGMYFFEAQVWKKAKMIPIELEKVYRQKEEAFLEVLNEIRNGQLGKHSLQLLNSRVQKEENNSSKAILLTTHNHKADKINLREMSNIPHPPITLRAKVEGKFAESAYPCQSDLILKKEARVMFIKNDREGRYYNGRLAVVRAFDKKDKVQVDFEDDKTSIWVEPTTWEKIRYSISDSSETIEPEVVGSFKQFPFRLAWAVTVHKSQGLTLEEVQLDLADSFAAGQTYVALSRCTTLEGLTLTSPITESRIMVDRKVKKFYAAFPAMESITEKLKDAKKKYALIRFRKAFSVDSLLANYEKWIAYIDKSGFAAKKEFVTPAEEGFAILQKLNAVGTDYQKHLERWIAQLDQEEEMLAHIIFKTEKGIAYFNKTLFEEIIQPLHSKIEEWQFLTKVKKYLSLAMQVYEALWKKVEQLYSLSFYDRAVYQEEQKYSSQDLSSIQTAKMISRSKKGATYEVTLSFFQEGMTSHEIAAKRNLSPSTIEAHLLRMVKEERLSIKEVISQARIQELQAAIQASKYTETADLKEDLGSQVSWSELRMMLWAIQENKI